MRASINLVLVALIVGIAAVIIRFTALAAGGGWSGIGPYDDAVYFMGTLNFIGGALPYRDYVLVHPPGIIVLLAPFGALSSLFGESMAFHVARAAWMLLGGLNTFLCWAVLRSYGTVAALSAAVFYALFAPVIAVEYTPMLETVPNTLLLLTLLLTGLLRAGEGVLSTHRALLAGIVIGMSPAIKIWGVVVILTLVAGIAHRFGRRVVLPFLVGSVISCTVVCLPFFLAAPGAMWTMVVTAQVGRPGVLGHAERMNGLLGLGFWPWSDEFTFGTAIMAGCLLVSSCVCMQERHLRPLVALTLTTVGVLMLAPAYFPAYAALSAVPITLTLALGVHHLRNRVRRPWSRVLAGVVATTVVLAAAVPMVSGEVRLGGRPFPTAWAAEMVAPMKGCVTSDLPLALIETNVVRRNEQRRCRIDADVGGTALVDRAWVDRDFRSSAIMSYLTSGQATMVLRPAIAAQLSTRDQVEILQWPVIGINSHVVIREPVSR